MSNQNELAKASRLLKQANAGQNVAIDQFGSATTLFQSKENIIINGGMEFDQEYNGVATSIVTDNTGYKFDGISVFKSAFTGLSTTAQSLVADAPNIATLSKSFKISILSSATPTSGDYLISQFLVEGLYSRVLGWGTSGAQPTSLSFWVKSSATGLHSLCLRSGISDATYLTSYNINQSNTWEYKTVSVPACTFGSWGKTTSLGLQLTFAHSMGAGGISSVANTWTTNNVLKLSNTVDLAAITGATWQITGVNLIPGSSAIPYQPRPYTIEQQLVKRYYQRPLDYNRYGSQGSLPGIYHVVAASAYINYAPPVEMRITPTPYQSGLTMGFGVSGTFGTVASIASSNYSSAQTIAVQLNITGQVGLSTSISPAVWIYANAANSYLAFDARL